MKKNKQRGSMIIVLIVIMFLIIFLVSYFYYDNKKASTLLDTKTEPISTTTYSTAIENSPSIELNNDKTLTTETSNKNKINEILELVKGEISLPLKLNDNITWLSLEGTEDSLLYKYVVKEVQTETSNASIKNNMIESLCDIPLSKSILDNDINIEYLYNIENSKKSYTASISKSDCI